jgi:hypothetical protein
MKPHFILFSSQACMIYKIYNNSVFVARGYGSLIMQKIAYEKGNSVISNLER